MTPRTYTDEFKQGAVDLVKSGISVLHVAEQLGIPRGTLWHWVHAAGIEVPHGEAVNSSAVETVDVATYRAALERIAELERENEMLAEASASFARRMRP